MALPFTRHNNGVGLALPWVWLIWHFKNAEKYSLDVWWVWCKYMLTCIKNIFSNAKTLALYSYKHNMVIEKSNKVYIICTTTTPGLTWEVLMLFGVAPLAYYANNNIKQQ